MADMEAHLAQINIGRLRAPADDPIVAEFMNALDEINALAEASPGFVWRYQTEAGNAVATRPYPDPLMIVNMSVWTSPEALKAYTYQSVHAKFYARRAAWFDKLEQHHLALWWIPAGKLPTVADGQARLEHRRVFGDTPYAFGFKSGFTPQDSLGATPMSLPRPPLNVAAKSE